MFHDLLHYGSKPMMALAAFAQQVTYYHAPLGGSWTNFFILIVVIAACVALVYVALKKFQVPIPDWVIQIFWIVVVAAVVIMAIRFVTSL